MSRLLNLLPWPEPALNAEVVTSLAFGPFYMCVDWFRVHPITGHLPWPIENDRDWVWQPPPAYHNDFVCRAVAWRLAFMWHLLANHGLLVQIFSPNDTNAFLSKLLATVDSTIPLIDYIEQTHETGFARSMDTSHIYKLGKAPEQCRDYVLDDSRVFPLLKLVLPTVIGGEDRVAPSLFRLLELDITVPIEMASVLRLHDIVEQMVVRKGKLRDFTLLITDTLSMHTTTRWLSNWTLQVLQCVLLGNYTDTVQFLGWAQRRYVYRWTYREAVAYLNGCVRAKDKDADTRTCLTLMTQLLGPLLNPTNTDSIYGVPYIDGWASYNVANQHILKIIRLYFPVPPPVGMVQEMGRSIEPLCWRYADLISAIKACPVRALERPVYEEWPYVYRLPIDWASIAGIPNWMLILCQLLPEEIAVVRETVRVFPARPYEATAEQLLNRMSPINAARLCMLARWIHLRRQTTEISGSHYLVLSHYRRWMEITGHANFDTVCTVLRCLRCDLVRFRPVGVDLQGQKGTMSVNLHWGQLTCMECGCMELTMISLMGNFLRCRLSQASRHFVTLAPCDACMHITVVENDRFLRHSPVCSECFNAKVAGTQAAQLARQCLNGCAIPQKTATQAVFCRLQSPDSDNYVIEPWCKACMPLHLSELLQNVKRELPPSHSIFARSELAIESKEKRQAELHRPIVPRLRRGRIIRKQYQREPF